MALLMARLSELVHNDDKGNVNNLELLIFVIILKFETQVSVRKYFRK